MYGELMSSVIITPGYTTTTRNRCKALTKKGDQCKAWPILGEDLCQSHLTQYRIAQGKENKYRCVYASKQGRRCKREAMEGAEHCYMHVPSTGTGIAHPNYTNGMQAGNGGRRNRYAGVLTTSINKVFEEANVDPNLLNLAPDVALLESLADDALKGMKTHESRKTWAEARNLLKQVRDCLNKSDNEGFLYALNDLESIFNTKVAYYTARDESIVIIEKKAKLASMERKRQLEMGMLLSIETHRQNQSVVAAALKQGLERYVSDKKARRKVLQNVQNAITSVNMRRREVRRPKPTKPTKVIEGKK